MMDKIVLAHNFSETESSKDKKKQEIHALYLNLLAEKQCDIDAACMATAIINGHSKEDTFTCDWIDDNHKTIGCPECPFIGSNK